MNIKIRIKIGASHYIKELMQPISLCTLLYARFNEQRTQTIKPHDKLHSAQIKGEGSKNKQSIVET